MDWVEQVNRTEFVLVLDYTNPNKKTEPDDLKDKVKAAVRSVTRNMQRIEYPSKELVIYVRDGSGGQ